MEKAAVSRVGSLLLSEIEEASLDEVLGAFRSNILANPSIVHHAASTATAHKAGRTALRPKEYPLLGLDRLASRHFSATDNPALELTGRHLHLLYPLIATLLAPPHNRAVILIDIDGRFDVTRLLEWKLPAAQSEESGNDEPPGQESSEPFRGGGRGGLVDTAVTGLPSGQSLPPDLQASLAGTPAEEHQSHLAVSPQDLRHLHIYRCATASSRAHVRSVIAAAEEHMIYGQHPSLGREWWGTIVIGGGQAVGLADLTRGAGARSDRGKLAEGNVDVTAAWSGWLRVDRAAVPGFGTGLSVEEALAERQSRQEVLEGSGWVASSIWGDMEFGGER